MTAMTETIQLDQPILTSLMYRKAKGEFAEDNVIRLDRDTLIRLMREYEGGDGRKHMRPRDVVRKAREGQLRLKECTILLQEDEDGY